MSNSLCVVCTIESVGTGTDLNYGMTSGNLYWISAYNGSAASEYTTGIIDESTINGVAYAINITQGGNFGGPSNSPSLVIQNPFFYNAVVNETISLSGKKITIGIMCNKNYETRYTGKIGSISYNDEGIVSLTCSSLVDVNSYSFPVKTIDASMCFGNEDADIIGKTIRPVYGNCRDYELYFCGRGNRNGYSIGLDSSNATFSYDENPSEYGIDPLLNIDGVFKGRVALYVHGLYQQTEGETNIRIAVSYGYLPLILDGVYTDDEIEVIINKLKSSFSGKSFECIDGVGKGNIYSIVDVLWEEHEVDGITNGNVWFVVDSISQDDFQIVGRRIGYVKLPSISDSGIEYLADDFYRTVYDSSFEKVVSGSSILKIVDNANRYLISRDINSSTVSGIIYSKESGESCVVDGQLKKIITTTSNSAYTIDSANGNEEDDYFLVREENDALSIWHETNEYSGSYFNFMQDGFDNNFITTGAPSDTPFSVSEVSDSLEYGEAGEYNSFTDCNNSTLFRVPINGGFYEGFFPFPRPHYGELKLLDNQTIAVVPKFKFEYDCTFYNENTGITFIYVNYRLAIKAHVVGENNTIIGTRTYDIKATWKFNKYDAYFGNCDVSIFIDPASGTVTFSDGCVSHNSGTEVYNQILTALSLESIINSGMNDYNRYTNVLLNIYGNIDHNVLGTYLLYGVRTTTKTVYRPFIVSTTQVNKKDLYLKIQYDRWYTPIEVVDSILEDAGLDVNDASFETTSAYQRTLFSYDPQYYDGQYHINNESKVSSVLSDIAKNTLTAIYYDKNGQISSKWLPGLSNDTTNYVIDGSSDFINGSFSSSTNNSGYRSTRYEFSVKKDAFGDAVKTVVDYYSGDFPSENEYEYGAELDCTLTNISYGPNWISYSVTGDDYVKLVQGGYYRLTTSLLDNIVVVDSLAPNMDEGQGVRVGFRYIIAGPLENAPAVVGDLPRLTVCSYIPKWKSIINVEDYSAAVQIYSICKEANEKVNLSITASLDVTEMNNPILGTDEVAIANWMKETLKYCTTEKGIVKFKLPMIDDYRSIKLMDKIEFSYGPYSTRPAIGYIVEIEDLYSQGAFELSILWWIRKPADEDYNINWSTGESVDFSTGETANWSDL